MDIDSQDLPGTRASLESMELASKSVSTWNVRL
jgi:hypothetical protein